MDQLADCRVNAGANLSPAAARDAALLRENTLLRWLDAPELWVFGYASLIWRPDFGYVERRAAHLPGWHRALKMWSRVNRGTPDQPGLVFALLSGGSCKGMAYRIARADAKLVFDQLWQREMALASYDPRWLRCSTPHGHISALAFTLSRRSPAHVGTLTPAQYQHIFAHAQGIYGSTRDYAHTTYDALRRMGIHDRALARILSQAHINKNKA